MIMKKFYVLLCTALAALAIVSCNKEPKEEPFVEPENQTGILSSTAVSLIKEADPNYWGEFVKSAQSVYNFLRSVNSGNTGFGAVKGEIADAQPEEEYYELQEDIDNWFRAIEFKDNVKFMTETIRLSLITGDLTIQKIEPFVVEVNPKGEIADEPEEEPEYMFVYTRSNNPLNLTFKYNEKNYKFQFEALDSDNNIIKRYQGSGTGEYDENGNWNSNLPYEELRQVAVPSKVALHVTENGASFLDVVLNPKFNDVNWDNFSNFTDEILGSATVTIPGYSLQATDVKLSYTGIEGKLELFHGNTSMLALDGKIDIDYPGNFWEEPNIDWETVWNNIESGDAALMPLRLGTRMAIPSIVKEVAWIAYTATNKVEGTLKVMGGQVVLKGHVYPHSLLKLERQSSSIYDERDARNADSMIQQYLRLDLSYNNGSKPQGRIVFTPIEQKVEQEEPVLEPKNYAGSPYKWTWGIRFADYSFKSFDELQETEDFDAVIGQAAIFMAHGNAIFDEVEEDEEEPKPLDL